MPEIPLQNQYLTAKFSPSGLLTHFSREGSSENLIDRSYLRYFDVDATVWHHCDPSSLSPDARAIEVRCMDATSATVTSKYTSEHLNIQICYELPESSPLLKIAVTVRGRGTLAKLGHFALPHIAFCHNFNDAFEDEEDFFFDGAEVKEGKELPCWRVFLQQGYEAGILLATRSKRDMTRFNILDRAIDLEPHGSANYTAHPVSTRPPMIATTDLFHEARFEIGAWQKSLHQEILDHAELNTPANVAHEPAQGKPPANLLGKMFHAVDFTNASTACGEYSTKRWMIANMPWTQKGQALVAGSEVHPPPVEINPQLSGVYRLFAGIGNGDGIAMRLSGDAETTFRVRPAEKTDHDISPAFANYLSGQHEPCEVELGTVQMDGRSIQLQRCPKAFSTTVLDYIRFEPLDERQVLRWQADVEKKPSIELSGFFDVPDIVSLVDLSTAEPTEYRANIWEHARCKFKRIYWRIVLCSDFPSQHNTMRYVSAKVHGVYSPQAKAYGKVLKKVDMLAYALEAAKEYGIELYGWMRFNNYTGNVQSDFFKQNPQFWEESEGGYRGRKLCLGLPEVRAHKIAILVEAAGYGLAGLNLGFLRHPPILLFHPVLLESYEHKYGRLPPRQRDRKDPDFINTLAPSDEEHARWYQHRADYMTLFGRELRSALDAKGLGHVKISIWVRPNHCLFDGIDLKAWLDEGLCDEVVCNGMIGPDRCFVDVYDPEVCGLRPGWKAMVQEKVPLVRCLMYGDSSRWQKELPEVLAEGYDGLCTYESNWAVLDPEFTKIYQSLRA